MSYIDLDQLTAEGLVAQYVLEVRASGLFLPYTDYQIVEEWLRAAPGTDELLLVLSDVLPEYFERRAGRGGPVPSLGGVKNRVLLRLQDLHMRRLVAP